jgi:hypothetical protein
MTAVSEGDEQAVLSLLDDNEVSININYKNEEKSTALINAAKNNKESMV